MLFSLLRALFACTTGPGSAKGEKASDGPSPLSLGAASKERTHTLALAPGVLPPSQCQPGHPVAPKDTPCCRQPPPATSGSALRMRKLRLG